MHLGDRVAKLTLTFSATNKKNCGREYIAKGVIVHHRADEFNLGRRPK